MMMMDNRHVGSAERISCSVGGVSVLVLLLFLSIISLGILEWEKFWRF